MAAQKEAFTPIRIPLKPDFEISCLCSSDDKVYIGTTDGRIISYNFSLDESDRQRLSLGQSQPTFTQDQEVQLKKAPVTKLELWGDQGMLFSLCAGEVRVWTTSLAPRPPVGCPDKVKFMASDTLPKSNKMAIQVEKKILK